ncbi:uncharacterized protein P884DRAFT_194531 [Thermothelomyces heterothallicus CBS 202.75]|uniref:uncharacterized protein n=1 Tax=Thermothelomyces heterothallicus CBS 202.75 TaxID=1149848 RepID=UPI00374209E4
MCRRYERYARCGHLIRSWWKPTDLQRCQEAKDRARRTGKPIKRCSTAHGGRSTHITNDNSTICDKTACYVSYYLMPHGWICHRCGGINGRNVDKCRHSDDRDYSSGSSSDSTCGHHPCKKCNPYSSQNRR